MRGNELESNSFFEFNINTYEEAIPASEKQNNGRSIAITSSRGRPRNDRSHYKECHTHRRVIRSKGHSTLPNIVGPFFPRPNDPTCRTLYCASMLALLVLCISYDCKAAASIHRESDDEAPQVDASNSQDRVTADSTDSDDDDDDETRIELTEADLLAYEESQRNHREEGILWKVAKAEAGTEAQVHAGESLAFPESGMA
ncbi:hypothetical protein P692DRAFT_20821637 [Suillus brevipes Sb2]|nr:hypothetical protein P692DRAFT_20821637 [Suillus brevipes Sb2]